MKAHADTLAVAVGALLAVALFGWARVEEGAPASTAAPEVSASRAVSGVPRIALDRLAAPRAEVGAGRRDVFDEDGAPAQAARDGEPPPAPSLPVPAPEALAPAPAAPSFSVKFIGAVEREGARVAVLMTDRKEILTGQAGEVVANRLKIVRIGLESVDVQDVGGGALRRLPLRAN